MREMYKSEQKDLYIRASGETGTPDRRRVEPVAIRAQGRWRAIERALEGSGGGQFAYFQSTSSAAQAKAGKH